MKNCEIRSYYEVNDLIPDGKDFKIVKKDKPKLLGYGCLNHNFVSKDFEKIKNHVKEFS